MIFVISHQEKANLLVGADSGRRGELVISRKKKLARNNMDSRENVRYNILTMKRGIVEIAENERIENIMSIQLFSKY